MHAMMKFINGPRARFRLVIGGVVLFSVLMIIIGGIDVGLGLGWGFSSKDVIMAAAVLICALVVNFVGGKIFSAVGYSERETGDDGTPKKPKAR
jgi:hypothetical protein